MRQNESHLYAVTEKPSDESLASDAESTEMSRGIFPAKHECVEWHVELRCGCVL